MIKRTLIVLGIGSGIIFPPWLLGKLIIWAFDLYHAKINSDNVYIWLLGAAIIAIWMLIINGSLAIYKYIRYGK